MQTHLAQLLEANRDELVSQYQRVLRETLFHNRAEMRPSQVKELASSEVVAFLGFLQQPTFSGAERGAQLYRIGLGEKTVLRLGQEMRKFFLPYLNNSQIAQMLELVDTYQEAIIQGYITTLEQDIFTEQERTLHAFQRAAGQG